MRTPAVPRPSYNARGADSRRYVVTWGRQPACASCRRWLSYAPVAHGSGACWCEGCALAVDGARLRLLAGVRVLVASAGSGAA